MSSSIKQQIGSCNSGSSSSDSSDSHRAQYYAPLQNEKFNKDKYRLIEEIGVGSFSRVYLVESQGGELMALKIQSNKENHTRYALDEREILKAFNKGDENQEWKEKQLELKMDDTNIVKMIEYFEHKGINENIHMCLIFELLGPTLLDLIQFYENKNSQMDLELVKHITREILKGLYFIHEYCNVIHTDIKPENIMIVLSEQQKQSLLSKQQDTEPIPKKKVKQDQNDVYLWNDCVPIKIDNNLKIKIVDFGNGCFSNQQYEEIQTKEYKSPEAIIQAPYLPNTDIWSLACMVFEMLTNNYLFKPNGQDETEEEFDHLAMILETIGQVENKDSIKKGLRSQHYFDNDCNLKGYEIEKLSISNILADNYQFKQQDAMEIEEFLLFMLKWDPEQRPSAYQVLQHKWLK